MDDIHIVWDLEDEPDGNVQHIQDHDVTMDEVEDVLYDRASVTTISRKRKKR